MGLIIYLTRIQFDHGAVGLLREEMDLLGVSRPLIVTDKGIVNAGLIEKVLEKAGGDRKFAIYDGTLENPDEVSVIDARDLFRQKDAIRSLRSAVAPRSIWPRLFPFS